MKEKLKKWYCSMFHTWYGTKDNEWYCKKCNKVTRTKRLSDYIPPQPWHKLKSKGLGDRGPG